MAGDAVWNGYHMFFWRDRNHVSKKLRFREMIDKNTASGSGEGLFSGFIRVWRRLSHCRLRLAGGRGVVVPRFRFLRPWHLR